MKQPHTEHAIQHTDDQQNTGNHPKSSAEQPGANKLGGTRAGAENVEIGGSAGKLEEANEDNGVSSEDVSATAESSANHLKDKSPDRDEFGRV